MPKKKFIDKKNAVTFHLVHRSQKDPLVADENAPQRVLVPIDDVQINKSKRNISAQRKEEQEKYGIFFDDEYDYLQHLRDVNILSSEWERVDNLSEEKRNCSSKEKPKINLPSSVFESNVEENIGLLNRAVPSSGLQLDLDPDIIAALDDDFDFENPDNALEDNFVQLANTDTSRDAENNYGDIDPHVSFYNPSHIYDDGKGDICRQYTLNEEDAKSHFTEYSISSSVMKRNEHLTLLDDKFDKMYSCYDENEIGSLDYDDIEGHIELSSNIVLQCANEYEQHQNQNTENIANLMQNVMKIMGDEISSCDEYSDGTNFQKLIVEVREKDKWDCDTFLSTHSTIYNHPKLISEIKGLSKIEVDVNTGVPKYISNGQKKNILTAKSLAQYDIQHTAMKVNESDTTGKVIKPVTPSFNIRSKLETPQQRKERKQAIKNFKRERRTEKNTNIKAFKQEKKRQEKILINNKINPQGNRIL